MRLFAGLFFVLVTLAGCGSSVDDVQSSPPALTMKVPAAWDSVGTCIAQFYASGNETTYLPVASEQRAKVIVKFVGPGLVQYISILFIFEITGGSPTTVVMRQAQGLMASNEHPTAKALIERCGKA